MLITITRADDHPADYILTAADAPTEWVRITPDALAALVLVLPDLHRNDEIVELLRVFEETNIARWVIENHITTNRSTHSDYATTAIELADWHRLRAGNLPAAFVEEYP